MSVRTGLKSRRLLAEVADERPSERLSGCLLGVVALAMISVGVLSGNGVVVGIGALMAGVLVLSRLARDFRSGVTSSNWGTWRRDENRAWFRGNICFWAAVTMLWFMLAILSMLGFIHVPSRWYS